MPKDTSWTVHLTVELQVQSDKPITLPEATAGALHAVEEALKNAENRGFNHDLADCASIGVAGVEVDNRDFI